MWMTAIAKIGRMDSMTRPGSSLDRAIKVTVWTKIMRIVCLRSCLFFILSFAVEMKSRVRIILP